ncbi:MAG: hypothetical protein H0V89_03580 [Deltaproteobacteria bacterium]|nr:hypothetical protein [Deltaproteobacteria bacterium]
MRARLLPTDFPLPSSLTAERDAIWARAGLDAVDGPAELSVEARYPLVEEDDLRWLTASPGRRLDDADDCSVAIHGAGDGDRRRCAAVAVEDEWTVALAEAEVMRQRVRRLCLAGVRIVDPARTYVEASVRVERGAVLWPDVTLRGETRIAGGAEIQQGCWLVDTAVESGAVVAPYTVCQGASIGPDAHVGPMAHLRPGARLLAGVKVGNFVEVKNTLLHPGAKASHLTYLGDAEIGADANIGAGTITCNYDGYGKHRTTIGARAFVGSNTSLVAPIQVGAGAIIGAGSVITEDVPADALAVERSDQRVLRDKAPRLRARNARLAGAKP